MKSQLMIYFDVHYNIVFSDSESSLYYLIMKSHSGIHDCTSRNNQTVETGSEYTTNRVADESNLSVNPSDNIVDPNIKPNRLRCYVRTYLSFSIN